MWGRIGQQQGWDRVKRYWQPGKGKHELSEEVRTTSVAGYTPLPPSPYLEAAAVRDGVNVRIGLSIKDMVQYLELLWCKELSSHLLPQEVPP